MHVLSAMAEVFNDIVIHGDAGRDDGVIQLDYRRPVWECT
jgi:hypothetical protein